MGTEHLLVGISALGISVAYFYQLSRHVSRINERLLRDALRDAGRILSKMQEQELVVEDLEAVCRKLRKRRHLIDDVKNGSTALLASGVFFLLAGYTADDPRTSFIALTIASLLLIPFFIFTMRIFYETEK